MIEREWLPGQEQALGRGTHECPEGDPVGAKGDLLIEPTARTVRPVPPPEFQAREVGIGADEVFARTQLRAVGVSPTGDDLVTLPADRPPIGVTQNFIPRGSASPG